MSTPLEVSADSSGYLAIKWNRKNLKANLTYAQIVTSTAGIKIGSNYSSLSSSADVSDAIAPEDDFTHAAANKAAVQAIMDRHAAEDDEGDSAMSVQSTPSTKVGGLIKLQTTTGGSSKTSNKVQYPNRYYIVGYDSNKNCVYISPNPCRDPKDQYFELLSKDNKFYLGWDNTHCYYDGYIALYNYEPALGSNSHDLKAFKKSQKTTKGYSYSTGITDDGNQWYAALCTKDCTTGKRTILRIVGVVESLQVFDLQYSTVPSNGLTICDQQVFTTVAQNSTDQVSVSSPAQAFSLEQSYMWSIDIGTKVGVSVSMSTGIPFIDEASMEVNIESSFNWSTQTANTKTQAVSLTQSVEVQPHSKNIITFRSEIGTVQNLHYTAKVKSLCRGGQSFDSINRDISGEYTGSVSNRIMVDVGPSTPLDSSPSSSTKMIDDDSGAISHVADVHALVHVVADEDTAMGSTGAKKSAFVGDADTIYWYYVDENGLTHPISGDM